MTRTGPNLPRWPNGSAVTRGSTSFGSQTHLHKMPNDSSTTCFHPTQTEEIIVSVSFSISLVLLSFRFFIFAAALAERFERRQNLRRNQRHARKNVEARVRYFALFGLRRWFVHVSKRAIFRTAEQSPLYRVSLRKGLMGWHSTERGDKNLAERGRTNLVVFYRERLITLG